MSKANKVVFVLCGLAFSLSSVLAGCSSNQDKQVKTQQQKVDLPHDPYSAPFHAASKLAESPDFTTTLLNGETFQLSKHRGEVVLLNFWATWCAPCRVETPELNSLYQKYKGKKVEFLGISVDKQGRSVVVPFVKKYHVSYLITIDDGHILKKYGAVMGYPTTYIIGPKGNLRYFATGAVTAKEVKPRLDQLLGEESRE